MGIVQTWIKQWALKKDAAAGDQPKERISETGQVNKLLYTQDRRLKRL